jgi:hypothetical protein
VIVPAYHHRQVGTHSWDALRDWFAQQSWCARPLPEKHDPTFGLPQPHSVWVRLDDDGLPERMAVSTRRTRAYYISDEKLAGYGWKLVELWDLPESVEAHIENHGMKCRSCGTASNAYHFDKTQFLWRGGKALTCDACDMLADAAIQQPTRNSITRLVDARSTLAPARTALRRVIWIAHRNGRKVDQIELQTLCRALGMSYPRSPRGVEDAA